MRFTWKGPTSVSAYPSNNAPLLVTQGPYPSSSRSQQPVTTTKQMISTIPRVFEDSKGKKYNYGEGSAYYDPLTKGVTFTTVECTTISTSLPNVCTKKLSRPLKVWRKRLNGDNPTGSKVTLNQLQGTSVIETKQTVNQGVHTDIARVKECVNPGRSCYTITSTKAYKPGYCSTTREYLQKRCKTYSQNQLQGKKLEEFTFTSGEGSEPVLNGVRSVTGVCNKIILKPSNRAFQEQGGVTSSSRTNRLKYDTVVSNVKHANYATYRATIDTGYLTVKGQNKPKMFGLVRARQDRPHIVYCDKV